MARNKAIEERVKTLVAELLAEEKRRRVGAREHQRHRRRDGPNWRHGGSRVWDAEVGAHTSQLPE